MISMDVVKYKVNLLQQNKKKKSTEYRPIQIYLNFSNSAGFFDNFFSSKIFQHKDISVMYDFPMNNCIFEQISPTDFSIETTYPLCSSYKFKFLNENFIVVRNLLEINPHSSINKNFPIHNNAQNTCLVIISFVHRWINR